MKAYGIRKQDDECCPGHSKYGVKACNYGRVPKAKNLSAKQANKARKAKERRIKFELV